MDWKHWESEQEFRREFEEEDEEDKIPIFFWIFCGCVMGLIIYQLLSILV